MHALIQEGHDVPVVRREADLIVVEFKDSNMIGWTEGGPELCCIMLAGKACWAGGCFDFRISRTVKILSLRLLQFGSSVVLRLSHVSIATVGPLLFRLQTVV